MNTTSMIIIMIIQIYFLLKKGEKKKKREPDRSGNEMDNSEKETGKKANSLK